MRAFELEESAVEELKNRLPKLKKHTYDTIDHLMKNISGKHKITGKKLHDMFVKKYGHTPDTWIKKYKKGLGEEGVAEGMDPDQQGRLNELIDDYNLSMKERSYWEADSILDKITREFGKDIADQVDQQGVAEATGDQKFDKMLKGITGKRAVAKQQKADTKQQARDAFGSMFGGGNPADKLTIRKKGVAEGFFGIDSKTKGAIQNVVSQLSDIPGMWDHQGQTFTPQGLEQLKSLLKNNKQHIDYAVNLTADDFDESVEQGVAEGEVLPLKRPMNKVQHGKRTFPPTQRDVKEPEGNVTPLSQKKSNVNEGVEGPEDIQKIKDFIKWSYKTLNMQKPYPRITISKDTQKAQEGHHTGLHRGNDIWVYVANRNLIDIFRTIFHELTHHRQMQLGMIKDGDSYPGSPIEMLADMAAGKYIKIYGKNHPEMFQ